MANSSVGLFLLWPIFVPPTTHAPPPTTPPHHTSPLWGPKGPKGGGPKVRGPSDCRVKPRRPYRPPEEGAGWRRGLRRRGVRGGRGWVRRTRGVWRGWGSGGAEVRRGWGSSGGGSKHTHFLPPHPPPRHIGQKKITHKRNWPKEAKRKLAIRGIGQKRNWPKEEFGQNRALLADRPRTVKWKSGLWHNLSQRECVGVSVTSAAVRCVLSKGEVYMQVDTPTQHGPLL